MAALVIKIGKKKSAAKDVTTCDFFKADCYSRQIFYVCSVLSLLGSQSSVMTANISFALCSQKGSVFLCKMDGVLIVVTENRWK